MTTRATGSTTTRLTAPQTPSLQLASAPIVNVVSDTITVLFAVTLGASRLSERYAEHPPARSDGARAGREAFEIT
ncbi:MAG: hypothetical protein ACLPTB_00695 [Acidimicrobiales bacterium]